MQSNMGPAPEFCNSAMLAATRRAVTASGTLRAVTVRWSTVEMYELMQQEHIDETSTVWVHGMHSTACTLTCQRHLQRHKPARPISCCYTSASLHIYILILIAVSVRPSSRTFSGDSLLLSGYTFWAFSDFCVPVCRHVVCSGLLCADDCATRCPALRAGRPVSYVCC